MATGDKYVNAVIKRFLSSSRIRTNILSYLKKLATDAESRFFPAAGLFTFPVSFTPSAGPPAYFNLQAPGSVDIEGTDGEGHTLILEVARQSNIWFENTPGDHYWVALHFIEIPDALQPNPMTGQPEYDKWVEEVGETDNPTSVTDMSGYIRVVVDSIFQNGVDFSGHSVLIWLHNPMSSDDTVAFETRTVLYNSGTGENYIDTAALFGQGTPSTSVADYGVACLGVTIRNAGPGGPNPFSDDYCILGYVDGHAVTPTWDAGDQVDLSGGGGHTLQKAYDGLAGSGSGRTISVGDQAVFLMQTSITNREEDIANAALRIVKDTDTALPGDGFEDENGIDIRSRFSNFGSVLERKNIAQFAGPAPYVPDELRLEEACDVISATQVQLTRSGVDLQLPNTAYGTILTYYDAVEISGSSLGNDGLYIVNGITGGDTITLRELNNDVPVLAVESGLICRIYRLHIRIDAGDICSAIRIVGMNDF